MPERFFVLELRPAAVRDSPTGGPEGWFIPFGSESWIRISAVEVLADGRELSRGTFLERFPTAPPLPEPTPS